MQVHCRHFRTHAGLRFDDLFRRCCMLKQGRHSNRPNCVRPWFSDVRFEQVFNELGEATMSHWFTVSSEENPPSRDSFSKNTLNFLESCFETWRDIVDLLPIGPGGFIRIIHKLPLPTSRCENIVHRLLFCAGESCQLSGS